LCSILLIIALAKGHRAWWRLKGHRAWWRWRLKYHVMETCFIAGLS